MRVLVQRVAYARVKVEEETVGEIGPGLLLLVGIKDGDTDEDLAWMAKKCASLRIFTDADGKMNDSVVDTGGGVLVVSQFTLYGNAKKGNRPSFVEAGAPEFAEGACARFVEMLKGYVPDVQTGRFAADMKVELLNDGPVTIWVER
ncbi:MAG: D-aminoacyl-tRNA deacylase [Deltaproteobacteria bacterium]